MTEDLTTWLRGVLDEDERTANGAGDVTADRRWQATEDPLGHHVEPLTFTAQRFGRVVLRAGDDTGCTGDESRAIAQHIARHDPASVLADIAAKRAILDLHDHYVARVDAALREGRAPNVLDLEARSQMERIARLLAAAYADRPGYREEWRP